MLSGRSEADTFGSPDPSRFTQPYFSNSAEAARGFADFGRAWESLGRKIGDVAMASLGGRLVDEAEALRADIDASIARSVLKSDTGEIVPAIAGARIPPDEALARDGNDPQGPYHRVYMEMLDSGVLSDGQIELVRNYLMHHHGLVLGMPMGWAEGAKQCISGGFLASGYGFALIKTDHIREALLMLYSEMAHEYTRGTWIAPEERDALSQGMAFWMHYCTPAQLTVASMVRWLLVFEDPVSDTLWLGKGIPHQWLQDGKTTAVTDAATRWGRVSFSITSHVAMGRIEAELEFPAAGFPATTKMRFRTDDSVRLTLISVNGKPWTAFEAATGTITLPSGMAGHVTIVVNCSDPGGIAAKSPAKGLGR
jgi:hypothetical protein